MPRPDLKKIRKEIDEAKKSRDELNGALKQILNDMEEEFGVKTLKAARKKLEEIREQKEKLDKKFKKAMEELEEALDNDEAE